MSEDKITAYRRRKDERRKARLDDDIVEKWRRRKDERQKANAYYAYKKRRADRKKIREDAKWITIGANPGDERQGIPASKGRHVLIDDEGKIISGAGGSMTGVELKGAKSSGEEVKVDPDKTSDPKPTSPAGAEGKTAGEVATEAKAKEGEGTGGAETVSKGGEPKTAKYDPEAAKKALGAADAKAWNEWLESAPEGTTLKFDDQFGINVYQKNYEGNWIDGDTGEVVSVADLGFDDETLEAFLKGGGGLYILDPETFEETELIQKTYTGEDVFKSKCEDMKSAFKGKIDDWDNWDKIYTGLKTMPEGTQMHYRLASGGEGVLIKKGDSWEGDEGDVVKTIPISKLIVEYEALGFINPETGELFNVVGDISGYGKSGEEPTGAKGKSDEEFYATAGETFKTAMDDKEKMKDWMDSAPAGTWAVAQSEDGESSLSCQKTLDGKWLVTNPDGDTSKFDAEKAAEMLTNNLEHFEDWQVAKGFGDIIASGKTGMGGAEPTGGETAGGETAGESLLGGGSVPVAVPKDFDEAVKSKEALKNWLDNTLDGTEVRIEDDSYVGATFIKGSDGKWQVVSDDPDDPGMMFDTAEDAAENMLEGLEALGNYKVTHAWSGETTTGTYSGSAGGETASGGAVGGEAEEEPDKPYVPKDDFGSVLSSKNSGAISKKLDEFKAGTVIEHDNGGNGVRYTKNDDGSWHKERQWGGKDWHDAGKADPFYMMNDLKATNGMVSVNGEEIKTFGNRKNEALAWAKEGIEAGIKALGLDDPDYSAYFTNTNGDEYQVVKQADGSFLINDGTAEGTKKINKDNLLKKIRNNDLWYSHAFNEEGWEAKANNMLKKHLAPIKSSLVNSDFSKFESTLTDVDNHSTFQLRNKDGSGFAVRKVRDRDSSGWHEGYTVKEIDKDGNVLKTEHFTDDNLKAMHDRLSEKTNKSTVFSNERDIKPYVEPEKKPTKPKYTGPKDGAIHTSESKTAGGLTKVSYGDESFSDGARAAAIDLPATEKGVTKMHEKLFPKMKTWWKSLTDSQRGYTKAYTGSYHDTNEPLRGFGYTDTSGWKDSDHISKKIKAIESAIDKSTLDEPIVLTRGLSAKAFNAMLQKKSSAYSDYMSYKTPTAYGDELIGKELTDPSFLSCTGVGKAGFGSKAVQLRIFAPAGTKACYAHPFSEFGMDKEGADLTGGKSYPYTGCEYEVILQRGSKFKIRGVSKKGGQLFLDVDLVEQNPRDMKVVGNKCVYSDGKDAYDF